MKSKHFCAKFSTNLIIFSTSLIILAKKNFGVRCTLMFGGNPVMDYHPSHFML